MRGLDDATQSAAEEIWSKARDAVSEGRALTHLRTLDTASLTVLQRAASLADPISVGTLSEEGAANLLLAPTEGIDRDHDGILERGNAKIAVFPPPDASPKLRAAWAETVDGLGDDQAMMLSADMILPRLLAGIGGGTQAPDYSRSDFDWSGWIARLKEGVEAGAAFNTAETTRRGIERLDRFLSALRDRNLAN